MDASRRVQVAFIVLVAAIFITLNAILGYYVINWSRLPSILMFVFLVFFNFSFALLLTKRILSFVVMPYQLAKLNDLASRPKVAILYATMNDIVPEVLSSVRQTYPSDVYVLDDSTDTEKRNTIDRIAHEKGFKIVRREQRLGYKAGATNNWIRLYGALYDYIVLLDADSYLPPDWVENALEYAEHPSNAKVSIFQGLINIWNIDNRFVRTLAPLHILGQDIWEKRLANHLDAVFCYGHNALVRMSHLREIGGFVEGYVSEDFATAVKLAEKGYKSRFIPSHTYEAMPENIRGFIKRQNKWTRGSMEFFSFAKQPSLSPLQRLLLVQTPLGHLAYIIILVTMLLTIFGYYSTTAHLLAFALNLLESHIFYILGIPLFQYVIVTAIVSGIILRLKLHQLGISNWNFFKYQFLSKAIGAIMLPYEVKTMLKYAVNRKLTVSVTPKNETALSLRDTLSIAKETILIAGLLSLGLVITNPLGIVYNAAWLAPFIIAPLVIYFFSRTPRSRGSGALATRTATNGSPIDISCRSSQPEVITALLNDARMNRVMSIQRNV